MKVKELIEKLQEVDKDLLVVQRGYERGMQDIGFSEGEIYFNENCESYAGPYEEEGKGEPIKAVILGCA